MNKEFVTYEQALALKELGFDEPCMSSRDMNKGQGLIQLPLKQQAFRWFREKYQLYCGILTEYSYGGQLHAYHITGKHQGDISKGDYKTYEEAELACLDKLIEIVKLRGFEDLPESQSLPSL